MHWLMDFEFYAPTGERPKPICYVAYCLETGKTIKKFEDLGDSPLREGDTLVAYYTSAELGCFRALGWDSPTHIIDLYCEFRNLTNGLESPPKYGLLDCAEYFRIDAHTKSSSQILESSSCLGS